MESKMAAKTIRVRCSESAKLLARDGVGNLIPGRYLGRNRRGEVIAEGVLVEQTSDVLRAVARGDLELVGDPPPSQEPAAAESAPAPEPEPAAADAAPEPTEAAASEETDR